MIEMQPTMVKIRDARIRSTSFRPRNERVDTLVLHYTELDLQSSLRVLRRGDVSVHYVLSEDGTAYKILENNEVAFHAGLSTWRAKPSVNERSIGIEVVNLDGNRNAYPPAQTGALIELCRRILAENPHIEPRNIVGHSDVAPKRKLDPGRKFPWKDLASAGIGLWPAGAVPEEAGTLPEIQALLERCGYPAPHAYGKRGEKFIYVADPSMPPIGATDIVSVGTADILRAFQLRFQPESAGGSADKTTMGLLRKLASIT
jgi:N-acetyl-anhydromuramyl-L-alanine amidase AmpD